MRAAPVPRKKPLCLPGQKLNERRPRNKDVKKRKVGTIKTVGTMKKLKEVPKFRSEHEEAAFWSTHDSTEYVDYSKAKRALFPNLKASTETISLRLPQSLLEHLKTLANKRDGPYQTLLKLFLADRVEEELRTANRGA